MARVQAFLAAIGCSVLILIYLQLQTTFDIRNANWQSLKGTLNGFLPLDLRQDPGGPNGDYLLGVGRADITGCEQLHTVLCNTRLTYLTVLLSRWTLWAMPTFLKLALVSVND